MIAEPGVEGVVLPSAAGAAGVAATKPGLHLLPLLADYVSLVKPRIISLLLDHRAWHDGGDCEGMARALVDARRAGWWSLLGGRRERDQLLVRPRHRRPHGSHLHPTGAGGTDQTPQCPPIRRWPCLDWLPRPRDRRKPAGSRACASRRALLRIRLHDMAEAFDAAEHRDRWRRRRLSSAGWRRRSNRFGQPTCGGAVCRDLLSGRRPTSGP